MQESVEGNWDKNLREWDGQVGEGSKRENNERDILIEGTIMELQRNLGLGKLPEIHKDDSN